MRKLKLTLSDDKGYTFSTLTRMQVRAIRSKERTRASAKRRKRQEELEAKFEKNKFNDAEAEEYQVLEDAEASEVLRILRMSVSAVHKEFAFSEDKAQEKELNERLDSLVDLRDMNRIVTFALSGTIPVETETIVKDTDIDLTV